MSTPSSVDHDADSSSSPPVLLAGRYRKGTVNAMATSRAQDAMIRHQVPPPPLLLLSSPPLLSYLADRKE
jgi:hypothetical protein